MLSNLILLILCPSLKMSWFSLVVPSTQLLGIYSTLCSLYYQTEQCPMGFGQYRAKFVVHSRYFGGLPVFSKWISYLWHHHSCLCHPLKMFRLGCDFVILVSCHAASIIWRGLNWKSAEAYLSIWSCDKLFMNTWTVTHTLNLIQIADNKSLWSNTFTFYHRSLDIFWIIWQNSVMISFL